MKVKLSWTDASSASDSLIEWMTLWTHVFQSVEITGSIRRHRPVVRDIDLIAVGTDLATPAVVIPLFESVGLKPGAPDQDGRKVPTGPRYYKRAVRFFVLGERTSDIQVDVFVVLPPARLPVIRLIRTGSADFSRAFVDRLRRYGLGSEDGRIVNSKTQAEVMVESESDLFKLAHLAYIEPENRELTNPATAFLLRNP